MKTTNALLACIVALLAAHLVVILRSPPPKSWDYIDSIDTPKIFALGVKGWELCGTYTEGGKTHFLYRRDLVDAR